MSLASRKWVRPRVVSMTTGETLLLEDVIASHVDAGDQGVIALLGGVLSGKTTAIRYLDEVLRTVGGVELFDEHIHSRELTCTSGRLKILTLISQNRSYLAKYSLAPWGQDECIEYLLANHKEHCASVMRRLGGDLDDGSFEGNPLLWQLVLDDMAEDESVASAKLSLQRMVNHWFCRPDARVFRNFALNSVTKSFEDLNTTEQNELAKCNPSWRAAELLRLPPVRMLLAVDGLVTELQSVNTPKVLGRQLPIELVRAMASRVRADSMVQAHLRQLWESGEPTLQPRTASLLHAADIGWKPAGRSPHSPSGPWLERAHLAGADWSNMDLRSTMFWFTDLRGAILTNTTLDFSDMTGANLSRANLHGASMARVQARRATLTRADMTFVRAAGADFTQANLANADLEGGLLIEVSLAKADLTNARFVRANLMRARLEGSEIQGADFSQANLEDAQLDGLDLRQAEFDHAVFAGAELWQCNLEGLELPGANFRGANLHRAVLTGSKMPQATFNAANLRQTGLADIEWEGVDLRNADLTYASFHLGSTRSGLVDSPYPSHGTRTGFYTDDFNEQDFKAPEEIRKANLRGADLRGAIIDNVDFYLVDLRDAIYDVEQEPHLRRCGAILEHRVG